MGVFVFPFEHSYVFIYPGGSLSRVDICSSLVSTFDRFYCIYVVLRARNRVKCFGAVGTHATFDIWPIVMDAHIIYVCGT